MHRFVSTLEMQTNGKICECVQTVSLLLFRAMLIALQVL